MSLSDLIPVSQIVVGTAKWINNERTMLDCQVILEGENDAVWFTAADGTGVAHVQSVWDAVTGGNCGDIASFDDSAERLATANEIIALDPSFQYTDANFGESGYQSLDELQVILRQKIDQSEVGE